MAREGLVPHRQRSVPVGTVAGAAVRALQMGSHARMRRGSGPYSWKTSPALKISGNLSSLPQAQSSRLLQSPLFEGNRVCSWQELQKTLLEFSPTCPTLHTHPTPKLLLNVPDWEPRVLVLKKPHSPKQTPGYRGKPPGNENRNLCQPQGRWKYEAASKKPGADVL